LNAVNGAGVEGLLIKVLEGRKVVGAGVTLAAGTLLHAYTIVLSLRF
jgi:lipoate-protein ligase A